MYRFRLRPSAILTAALICLLTPLTGAVSAQNPAQVIAVATRDENTQISDIFTIQLNGANRTNLTQHPSDDILPAWSPDGKRIAFASDRAGSYDIWLMREDGSNPINITDSPLQESRPIWSPDGAHIMYFGHSREKGSRDANHHIFVIRLKDGKISQLTQDDLVLRGIAGSWSPDATQIMFAALRKNEPEGSDSELYIQHYDDRRVRLQVTDNKFYETSPYWISNYEVVYFYTEILYHSDDTRGYYRLNPVTGGKTFLIDPFNIYSAVGFEAGALVMLFDGLDGICYFNTETGVQFFVDNTGPFDDSISWKPTAPEPSADTDLQHKLRQGTC